MPNSPKNIVKEYLKHLKAPPKPAGSFNPLKAKPDELIKYGYPRKPPKENKAAREIWKAIVTGKRFDLSKGRAAEPLNITPSADYQLNYVAQNFPGADETSENWSGAVTRATGTQVFTSIFASFQIPRDVLPPYAMRRGTYRSSAWIGLDGHDPTSPSMPQVGVTLKVDVLPGVVHTSFEPWFQWWSRQAINPPLIIDNFQINAGDNIACSIDVVSDTIVNVAVQNSSINGSPTALIPVLGGVPGYNGSIWHWASVAGRTAEWIVERPTRIKNPKQRYTMPLFSKVTFTAATVTDTSEHDPGPLRKIRMVNPVAASGGAPGRLVVLSRARKYYGPHHKVLIDAGPRLAQYLMG